MGRGGEIIACLLVPSLVLGQAQDPAEEKCIWRCQLIIFPGPKLEPRLFTSMVRSIRIWLIGLMRGGMVFVDKRRPC